ncbi:hypothetical protein D3C76_1160250 [compost metagenome]
MTRRDRRMHPLQGGNPLLTGGFGPSRKRCFCRRNRAFGIVLIRKTDLTEDLRGGWIVEIKTLCAVRRDKFAVNKNLFDMTHNTSSG